MPPVPTSATPWQVPAGWQLVRALPPPHPTRAPAGVVVAVTDMTGSAAAGRRATWAPLLRRVGLLLAAVGLLAASTP